MTALELDDIQGIVLRGYDQLRGAVLALLRIDDAVAARRWLAEVASAVTSARREPAQQAINLAFTAAGVAALRGPEVTGFPTEFLEGMVTPHRSRLLGDCADSAPEGWAWGGPRNQPVHVVLMLYAGDDAAATALHARLQS
ncbi:MAG: peroxidase, partial [Candidatus Binatia bacterium]